MYTKLTRCLSAVALLAAARVAMGQDPVRLPGVVVKAPVEKPGPRALGGVARDTFALPIDSVEISIPDLKRRALTDGEGKFRFDQVRPGEYDVRARKIGYAPQVVTVKVDSAGGVGVFELLQLRRALPPVIVNAARGGIGGVVGDTAFRAIPGATVRLANEGQSIDTDSSGYFHFNVGAGQYFLTVKRPGYVDKVVSVRVPPDSGRRVSIFLEERDKALAARSYWNVDDMAERVALRTKTNSSLYSREDLLEMGVDWISDAVQSGFARVGPQAFSDHSIRIDKECVAIVNGGPETTQIKNLTIDDIATVEIYPPTMVASQRIMMMDRPGSKLVGKKGVADSRVIMPFENAQRAAIQNAALNCATVYVWMR